MSPHGHQGPLNAIHGLNLNSGSPSAGHHHLIGGPSGNNSKTPKEAYKRLQGIIGNGGASHDRSGLATDDNRLNLSVDIAGRHSPGNQANSQHQIHNSQGYNQMGARNPNFKKHGHGRDGISLRMSRINDGEKLLNNSVHDFSGSNKKQQ